MLKDASESVLHFFGSVLFYFDNLPEGARRLSEKTPFMQCFLKQAPEIYLSGQNPFSLLNPPFPLPAFIFTGHCSL